jgi:hypothetical protein
VPAHIKRKLLEENMRFRRIKYSQELAIFLQNRRDWDEEQSKRATLNEARRLVSTGEGKIEIEDLGPKRPRFKTIIPTDEMITLIDKGLALAAEEKKSKLLNALDQAAIPSID